jgi:hypothetical protein
MEVTVGLPVEWMRGVFEDCGVDLLEGVAEFVWGFCESPTPCDAMLKAFAICDRGCGKQPAISSWRSCCESRCRTFQNILHGVPHVQIWANGETLFPLLRAPQVCRR